MPEPVDVEKHQGNDPEDLLPGSAQRLVKRIGGRRVGQERAAEDDGTADDENAERGNHLAGWLTMFLDQVEEVIGAGAKKHDGEEGAFRLTGKEVIDAVNEDDDDVSCQKAIPFTARGVEKAAKGQPESSRENDMKKLAVTNRESVPP